MKVKVMLFLLLAMFAYGVAYGAEKVKKLKDGSELVYIPGGEFEMGSDEDIYMKPIHKVKLKGFYIGKYEVTNSLYKKFCDAKKRKYPENPKWDDKYFLGKPDYPVINVSWEDAAAYAKWTDGRLPTEAEFEYATRGVTTTRYYWGEELSHEHLNYAGVEGRDRWEQTSPVGSFPPNPYGLYDMLGNVWEWVADWYGEDYFSKSPRDNPKGPKRGIYRVLKGDSWNIGTPRGTAQRWKRILEGRDYIGFRIALSAAK